MISDFEDPELTILIEWNEMASIVFKNITAIHGTASMYSRLVSGRICSRRTNYNPTNQMKNKFN